MNAYRNKELDQVSLLECDLNVNSEWPRLDLGENVSEFQPALPGQTLKSSPEDASTGVETICPRSRSNGD